MLSLSDIVNVKVGIGRGVFEAPGATVIGGKKPSFNLEILKLFSNGEQGFYYDPNDLSTMYQDAAGTTPVTAAGQPVGLMLDKSGCNNHARQTVSASRPILQRNATTGAYYLAFDGTDDFLVTNNIDFTATDKLSLFAGVRKYANSVRVLCELSSDMNANAGSFYLTAPENGQGQYGFKARANANQHASMTALTQNTSIDDICVLSASSDLSSDRNTIRRNGVFSSINYELGGGNYGNYPLYIGRRGGTSLPFNGHIYGLIGVGKLTSDKETAAIEKELSKRLGVTLNV